MSDELTVPHPDLSRLNPADIELDVGPVPEVSEAEVSAFLARRLGERIDAELRVEGERLEASDEAVVDVVVTLAGEEYPRAAWGGEHLSPGSWLWFLRPSLENAVVGGVVETLTSFPSDFADEAIAGRDAELVITVKAARAVPALDLKDPAVRAALDLGPTPDDILAAARMEILAQARGIRGQRVREDLLDALFEQVEVSCPDDEIDAALDVAWAEEGEAALLAEGADEEEVEAARLQFMDSLEVRAAYARASCARQVFEAIAERDGLEVASRSSLAQALLTQKLDLDDDAFSSSSTTRRELEEAVQDLALELAVIEHLLAEVTLKDGEIEATDLV